MASPTTSADVAAANRVRLDVAPNPAYADEEVAIRSSGLAPHSRVTIRARARDHAGRSWESQGVYLADDSGNVNPAAQESLAGSYRGTDAMGLFWSMQLAGDSAKLAATFFKEGIAPDSVTLSLEAEGRELVSTRLERRWLAPETEVLEVREDGLVAQLFLPPGRSPHPTVIVLGGSGGGYDLDKAALLARHGFATLALAYFGPPPLPPWLHRVPLEYFERALAWLARQPEIDSRRMGLFGISRGAELGLILGSMFPQIRAIVAYAPSAVCWGSGGRDTATGEIIPCWTWRGQPVPFAPLPLRNFIVRSALPVGLFRRPAKFRNLFRLALRNRDAVEQAKIAVERICGPILLVSSGDDHVWPGGLMAEMLLARLRAHGFAHKVEHLHYPDAGHALRYPFLPTTARASRPRNLKYSLSLGGSALADTAAQSVAWRRAISFLQENL
jgi:dienelactone hydrolase